MHFLVASSGGLMKTQCPMTVKSKAPRPKALSQTLKDLELQLEAWDRLARRKDKAPSERDVARKTQILFKKLSDQIKGLS